MRMYPDNEPPLDRHEAGLTMRVVGWTLVVFAALFIAFFAPVSLRGGSKLWVVWAVVQGIVGLTMVAVGAKKEEVTVSGSVGSIVAMPPVYRPEEPRRAA